MAQRDPLNEYKAEALELFKSLMAHWDERVTEQLMRIDVTFEAPPSAPMELPPMQMSHPAPLGMGDAAADQAALADLNARINATDFASLAVQPAAAPERNPHNPATWGKVGRNEPCPCGSGKKYKHCHGVLV